MFFIPTLLNCYKLPLFSFRSRSLLGLVSPVVNVLRSYVKLGVSINLLRLGFCWLGCQRAFFYFSNVFFSSVILRICMLSSMWNVFRLLVWVSYASYFGASAQVYGLRPGHHLLVYTSRHVSDTRVPRRPVWVASQGDLFSDRDLAIVSDRLRLTSSFFSVRNNRCHYFGFVKQKMSLVGLSRLFFRSRFKVSKITPLATRAIWPLKNRVFWLRTQQWLRRRKFRFLKKNKVVRRRRRRLRFKWRRLLKRGRVTRYFFLKRLRRRNRGLYKVFPGPVTRNYRFIRKYRALFTVRALHTNLFFTIRQGKTYFSASTGMFDDLKHGTKRKRTLLAGWFLADRLFDLALPYLKEKTIFRVDLYGRTSGRRGIWFSWRTKPWRLYIIKSRTPVAYNGTRGCRRRRL